MLKFEPVYKFRESRPVGQVMLLVDDVCVYRASEYRTVAEYAKSRYGLRDDQLMLMYYDYKEDYDSI